ncbi:MAG TPA: 8-amino-7-oxononanoate synthase [Polyangiales bacterium]|nr:8-amino-7-oxononanoate synthase [Polyangiales bacterium]
MIRFHDAVHAALSELEHAGLLRAPRVIAGAQGPEVEIEGRRVLNLCSNNYLGLAGDPRLAAAAIHAIQETGIGAGASRQISGTGTLHRAAETRLAAFVGLPGSVLFSTGYAANVGAIPALVDPDALILSDRLNHASLIDGCRLSRARVLVYEHLDCDHIERLLRAHRAEHSTALLVTESLFSMDGDLAPLADLRALCDRYELGLYVDEAHAIGVLGPHGRGACADARVTADVLVGTLGKAFGVSGAFVAGTSPLVRLVENRSRSFVFSTASPAALAAAVIAATDAVEAADDRRAVLAAHAIHLRTRLEAAGYRVSRGTSAIIPVVIGDPVSTMRLSADLLAAGVFVHGIRPPTVAPGTSRLRMTPMATHSRDQLDAALAAFPEPE